MLFLGPLGLLHTLSNPHIALTNMYCFRMSRKKSTKPKTGSKLTIPPQTVCLDDGHLCAGEKQLVLAIGTDFCLRLQATFNCQLEGELWGDLSPLNALAFSGCHTLSEGVQLDPWYLSPKVSDTGDTLCQVSEHLTGSPPLKHLHKWLDLTKWLNLSKSQKSGICKWKDYKDAAEKLVNNVQKILAAYQYSPCPFLHKNTRFSRLCAA